MRIKTSELTEQGLMHVLSLPDLSWQTCGPIIDWEGISTRLNHKQSQLWEAYIWLPTQHDLSETDSNSYTAFGTTPLIAAMRCFCSKLGDTVEVPDELF